MTAYAKILVAVDLADDCIAVVKRAMCKELVCDDMTLVHVFEPMPAPYASVVPYAPGMIATEELDFKVKSNLQQKLLDLGQEYGIAADRCIVLDGRPANRVKNYADENDFDLIVIGTHGRHGMGLMLGSTANGMLHGTPCDVLAVRIGGKG